MAVKAVEFTRQGSADATVECVTDLFREYAHSLNSSLRDRLILSHQSLVRYLAGRFVNRGIPLDDLVQVGMIGLINAVDRFDPDRGSQFSTYAVPTILGEIRRCFRDTGWNLKIPRRLQELNLAAIRAVDELKGELHRSPSIQEVAARIGVTEEETLEAIEIGQAYETTSLDAQIPTQDESTALTLSDLVGHEDSSIRYSDLRCAVSSLEQRERTIIFGLFFEDMTQTELARRLNISQMHVSRLQQKALRQLRKLLDEPD